MCVDGRSHVLLDREMAQVLGIRLDEACVPDLLWGPLRVRCARCDDVVLGGDLGVRLVRLREECVLPEEVKRTVRRRTMAVRAV